MKSYSIDNDISLDGESRSPEGILLSPEQVEQAIQLSQGVTYEVQQWQIYLQGLALSGFKQWLGKRATDLRVREANCSISHPQYANLIPAVCNLEVGEFKLCLLTSNSLKYPWVNVPRAAIELPEFIPHFYVLIEVLEEQEQVRVCGCLPQEQLHHQQQISALVPQEDWNYLIPLNWFNLEPDELLLYLRCLEPQPIPLSSTSTQFQRAIPAIQAELTPLLPQLRSPDCILWQVLSWEQGANLLSNPELADWLYHMLRSDLLATDEGQERQRLGATQQAINVGLWLQNRLDELAQELSWVLLPPLEANLIHLRSSQEDFQAVIEELTAQGISIPPQARGAYWDWQAGAIAWRLSVVIWELPDSSPTPEWTLLLLLGGQPETSLPVGIRLKVEEPPQVLVEESLRENTPETYLYAQVIGTQEEQFSVTVEMPDGAVVSLPPFVFFRQS